MILNIIGIVIGLIAIGLIFYFRKDQQSNNIKIETNMAKTDKSLIALQEEFTNYQVTTERKIAGLEKQLEIKSKNTSRQIENIKKELPSIIKKIIGHIEFAKPMNR
jgi:ligand-binding sensor protein